jgi:hypothetical protein
MTEQAANRYGLKVGTPAIASAGPITFGPDDVLFLADNRTATIFAIEVSDDAPAAPADAFDLDDLDTRLCAFLGCSRDDLVLRDLAVHPRTHNVYVSLMRGRGNAGTPVIVRIDHRDGSLSEVALQDVAFSQVAVDNAPTEDDPRQDFQLAEPDGTEVEIQELDVQGRTIRIAKKPLRASTITDLAYADGMLLVAGMSNEEFASNLRRVRFPFDGAVADNSLEIFHVSHGKWETHAPIRTFVPYEDGRSILASYTCTPLVYFPLSDLASGTHLTGRTVAELGPVNQPLDMVSFRQGDGEYLLIAHSSHPLMKISCADIEAQSGLTEAKEPVGVPREEINLPGIRKLANFNGDYVLALQQDESGARHLRSLKTASL